MTFDIISTNFNDNLITFIPKYCPHIKTITINDLLNQIGYRYCSNCYEKKESNTYQKILECIEKKECILLTTKNEFMHLNMNTLSKIKIIGKCEHQYQTTYWDFINSKGLCKNCLNVHRSITRKNFYTENKNYAEQIELNGNELFINFLDSYFNIESILNCNADMLIKPKNIQKNLWLPIQLKATLKKDPRHCYKFSIKDRNYKNTILICICINEKKFWIFEGFNG